MLGKRLLGLLLVLVLVVCAGCSGKKAKEYMEISDSSPRENPIKIREPVIPTVKSILTGLDIPQEFDGYRPLAIMIENEYNARPQSGLDKAGVVYEILAEGGITRFLALFLGEEVDEIGPVRSARPYYIDYAMENDGIYIHYGASPQGYSDLQKLKINAIDGIYDSNTFWRDKTRRQPHNAYTSTDRILETSKKLGFRKKTDLDIWTFDEKDLVSNVEVKNVKLKYFNDYTVGYTYDFQKKAYGRYINGKAHTDRITGDTIFVKNIIVQFAKAKVVDDVGRLDIKTVSSGKGYYIREGTCQEILWQKDSRKNKTKYTFLDGTEIAIKPGNVWIHIMPQWGEFAAE